MKRKILNAGLRPLGYRLERLPRRALLDGRVPVHFLHLGKNGGTALSALVPRMNEQQRRYRVYAHGHRTSLWDLPSEDLFFFSIRDPVDRFKSGFYSRKREGRPRIFSPWTRYERDAFETFEHANDLAEALFREDELGMRARGAIKSIQHTAMDQVIWFNEAGNFLALRPPIFIIRQACLTADLAILTAKLGIEQELHPPKDDTASHRNDYSHAPDLSAHAVANLRTWYVQDIYFYDACSRWIVAQGGVANPADSLATGRLSANA